jgi:tetratricopeptide (TPR) repeat protein
VPLTLLSRAARLEGLALGGIWATAAAFTVHRLFAFDIWWQMAAGEWIAAHGIPRVDPFSFGFPGREWIEPRWLWCLLVHAIQTRLGLNFLIAGAVLAVAGVFGLLAASGRGLPGWIVALGSSLLLVAGHERFTVRPELISFLGLALVLLAFERWRRGASVVWLWALVPLQVVWSNAHTLWILGPATLWILLAGALAESLVGRRPARVGQLALVAAAASLAALVNPYGLRGVQFPFVLLDELRAGHLFSETIAEFRGPFAPGEAALDFRTLGLAAVIGVFAGSFLIRPRGASIGRLALGAAYLFLALEARRNAALFGLVAGWVTMLNLGEAQRAGDRAVLVGRLRRVALVALAALPLVLVPAIVTDRFYRAQGSLKRFGFGVSEHRFPVRALAFLRREGLPGPVLHALGDGGYVRFEGGPGSVYADGRLEVYGAESLRRAFRVTWTGEGIEEEAERTGASAVLVRNDPDYGALLAHLERSDQFEPVYFDPLHVVYVRRTSATEAGIERLAIDWRAPRFDVVEPPADAAPPDWIPAWWPRAGDAFFDERLGSLFAAVGNYALAERYFSTAYARDPGNRRVCLFLALFRQAAGRDAEADELLSRVPASYLEEPAVHELGGRIALAAGNRRRAVEHFERAEELSRRAGARSSPSP